MNQAVQERSNPSPSLESTVKEFPRSLPPISPLRHTCCGGLCSERTEDFELRVLIIEDDETFCQFLSELLKDKGNEVVSSTDAFDGYEKAWAYPYDLFILDVRTPGLLGTEIAEALKQNNPGAKVVLISAFADDTLRQTASSLGAALLSKPFSADDLFEVIDRARSEQAEHPKNSSHL